MLQLFMSAFKNIHTEFHYMLGRENKGWVIDTETQPEDESLDMLFKRILPLVQTT